jgi:hypothetical protein
MRLCPVLGNVDKETQHKQELRKTGNEISWQLRRDGLRVGGEGEGEERSGETTEAKSITTVLGLVR